jgi:hypothetical protein
VISAECLEPCSRFCAFRFIRKGWPRVKQMRFIERPVVEQDVTYSAKAEIEPGASWREDVSLEQRGRLVWLKSAIAAASAQKSERLLNKRTQLLSASSYFSFMSSSLLRGHVRLRVPCRARGIDLVLETQCRASVVATLGEVVPGLMQLVISPAPLPLSREVRVVPQNNVATGPSAVHVTDQQPKLPHSAPVAHGT